MESWWVTAASMQTGTRNCPVTSGGTTEKSPETPEYQTRRCLEETASQRARTEQQRWPFAVQRSQSGAGEACDLTAESIRQLRSGVQWRMLSLHTCVPA